MPTDPMDPTMPMLRIAVEPRLVGQTVLPVGFLGILAGDSCEVVAEPHTIRIETFVVTDAMRDADKARFAYTSQLADENRALIATVRTLDEDIRRLRAALEIAGHITEGNLAPTVATFLGDPLELPPDDPFRVPDGPTQDVTTEPESDSKDRS